MKYKSSEINLLVPSRNLATVDRRLLLKLALSSAAGLALSPSLRSSALAQDAPKLSDCIPGDFWPTGPGRFIHQHGGDDREADERKGHGWL
jgi:hypothetical protein